MLVNFTEKSDLDKPVFSCKWDTLDIKPDDLIMYKSKIYKVVGRTYDVEINEWYVLIQEFESWKKENEVK